MFNERYNIELERSMSRGLYRKPISILNRNGQCVGSQYGNLINFSSNDYLGLGSCKKMEKSLISCIKKYGKSASSSRLITGNYKVLTEAEKVYAQYFGFEDSIFFPSGFQANNALVSTMFNYKDTLLFDKKIHASIVKGLQMTNATFKSYRHNSIPHLTKRVKACSNSTVISESLFSMSGDLLPVKDIEKLKMEYSFKLIVDEAHSFGVLGQQGRGIAGNIADISVGTMGKAFGSNGAFILMPKNIKEYFINFCSPLIYTTALPPYFGPHAIDILNEVSKMDKERSYVKDMGIYIKEEFSRIGLNILGDAHIKSIEIGDEERAAEISQKLIEKGILLTAVRYPTVEYGKAILRLGVTSNLKRKDVDRLIKEVKEIL